MKLIFTPKIITTLNEGYNFQLFKSDFIAGLTVAIVALPLAMALAIASGASPDKGLVTAVIAGFLVSLLGGSRVQIGGPTGAFVVVIFGVITNHGYDGLILATIMAGIILIISGYAKLGQIIKFIPYPVITGFTSGIAVIIAVSQVKDFFGLRIENIPTDFIAKWESYFSHFNSINLSALAIGILALLIIIVLKKYTPKLPGYLIAIFICAITAYFLHLPIETIGSKFPNLPSGIPMPEMPSYSFEKMREVVPSAFTIAFLAGIEALLSAVVADGMTGFKHRSNQELVGQGMANIASAFFGGLPATGAIARTVVNIKAGGKTPLAGIFHALLLLAFMICAMNIVAYIPMAVLAAILFVVAWRMSEIHHFFHIMKLSLSDRAILILTFLLTIFVDLTVAIGVGVTLSSLLFMRHMSQSIEIRSHKKQDEKYQEEDENQRIDLPANVEVFQINGPLFFGVASELLETLKSMGQMPKVLILRMRFVPYLDATGESILEDVIKQCRAHATKLILSGLRNQPLQLIKSAGIIEGDDVAFTPNFSEAINVARRIAADA